MKICYKCKESKDDLLFPWQNKKENRRHRHCNDCHKIYCRQWYKNNSESHKKITRQAGIDQIKRSREYIASLNIKCKECEETHPAVLDFHHRDPATKEFSVGDLISRGYSLNKIKAEIEKCDILCSNCHRKHHWNERI